MRNQIDAATRLGLTALTFNSSLSKDERQAALDAVHEADLLFVTPESLQSAWFAPDVLSRVDDLSAVVVDDVHCISEWGHDFRPKYCRIRDFLAQLPSTVGVLGMTATATQRTIDDIVELVRPSLYLHVLPPREQPTDQAHIESLFGHLNVEHPHLLAIADPAVLRAELAIRRAHYKRTGSTRASGRSAPTTSTKGAARRSVRPAARA